MLDTSCDSTKPELHPWGTDADQTWWNVSYKVLKLATEILVAVGLGCDEVLAAVCVE